ncbi:hypothetical protein [Haloarcula sediminis]|uniref:hypothetical protein n=1 Tax=Haloarcula sediminis TaxID=3111777 RepID=UPI00387E9F0B
MTDGGTDASLRDRARRDPDSVFLALHEVRAALRIPTDGEDRFAALQRRRDAAGAVKHLTEADAARTSALAEAVVETLREEVARTHAAGDQVLGADGLSQEIQQDLLAAATALAKADPGPFQRAGDLLLECLQAEVAPAETLSVLSHLGSEQPAINRETATQIRSYLDADSQRTRYAATAALGSLVTAQPAQFPSVVDELAAMLSDPTDRVRTAASRALMNLALEDSATVVPVLDRVAARLGERPDDHERTHLLLRVFAALCRSHPDAIGPHLDSVTPFLDAADEQIRETATHILTEVGTTAPDDTMAVRSDIETRLSNPRAEQGHLVRTLQTAWVQTRDSDVSLAEVASGNLDNTSFPQAIGEPETLVSLYASLDDDAPVSAAAGQLTADDPEVRRRALSFLVSVGLGRSPEILVPHGDAIAAALDDPDPVVRSSAALGISVLTESDPDAFRANAAALEGLLDGTDDERAGALLAAAEAAERCPAAATGFVDALAATIETYPGLAPSALAALVKVGEATGVVPTAHLDALVEGLSNEDPDFRTAAAGALVTVAEHDSDAIGAIADEVATLLATAEDQLAGDLLDVFAALARENPTALVSHVATIADQLTGAPPARRSAAATLALVAESDPEAVATVVGTLGDVLDTLAPEATISAAVVLRRVASVSPARVVDALPADADAWPTDLRTRYTLTKVAEGVAETDPEALEDRVDALIAVLTRDGSHPLIREGCLDALLALDDAVPDPIIANADALLSEVADEQRPRPQRLDELVVVASPLHEEERETTPLRPVVPAVGTLAAETPLPAARMTLAAVGWLVSREDATAAKPLREELTAALWTEPAVTVIAATALDNLVAADSTHASAPVEGDIESVDTADAHVDRILDARDDGLDPDSVAAEYLPPDFGARTTRPDWVQWAAEQRAGALPVGDAEADARERAVDLLVHPDDDVQDAAARLLADIADSDPGALEPYVGRLATQMHTFDNRHAHVAEALCSIAAWDASVLVPHAELFELGLASDYPAVLKLSLVTLRHVAVRDTESVPKVVGRTSQLLNYRSVDVRRAALDLLCALLPERSHEASQAVRHVVRMLDDEPSVRRTAVDFLREVAPQHPDGLTHRLDTLVGYLDTETSATRAAAVELLATTAADSPSALEPYAGRVAACLDDSDPAVRQAALGGLVSLAEHRPPLVAGYLDRIVDCLDGSETEVRNALSVCFELAGSEPDAVEAHVARVAALLEGRPATDPGVALGILGKVGSENPDSLAAHTETVRSYLDARDDTVAATAARVLGEAAAADPATVRSALPTLRVAFAERPATREGTAYALTQAARHAPERLVEDVSTFASVLRSTDSLAVQTQVASLLAVLAGSVPSALVDEVSALTTVLSVYDISESTLSAFRAVQRIADGGTVSWADVEETLTPGEWGRLIETGLLVESDGGYAPIGTTHEELVSAAPDLRYRCLRTCAAVSEAHPEVVAPHTDTVAEFATDDDRRVRRACLDTLAQTAAGQADAVAPHAGVIVDALDDSFAAAAGRAAVCLKRLVDAGVDIDTSASRVGRLLSAPSEGARLGGIVLCHTLLDDDPRAVTQHREALQELVTTTQTDRLRLEAVAILARLPQ